MSEKIVNNWYQLADYDIGSADAMLKSGRYIYVAFLCQQAVEKTLKGLFVKETLETPPYTHNLRRLAKKLNLYNDLSEKQIELIDTLNVYYIESRYTETIENMMKLVDKTRANQILTDSREMLGWLEIYKK